MESKVLKDK